MSTEAPEKNQAAQPPRDDLYRAVLPGAGLIRAEGDGEDTGPVLAGHFAVFNQWTEIHSSFEGHFLERFAPGAFKKTIKENIEAMRVLFQHGFDRMIDEKPLGPIRSLEEDSEGEHVDGVSGVWYEVPLLDASYVRDLVQPGLEAELYGSSMRFRSIREEFDLEPGQSDENPNGLPERTIKEAQVKEFGPVTFPAYVGASAGVRSLTDEFVAARFARDPERLRELIANFTEPAAPTAERKDPSDGPAKVPDKSSTAPSEGSAEPKAHPDRERRDDSELIGVTSRKNKTPSWRL